MVLEKLRWFRDPIEQSRSNGFYLSHHQAKESFTKSSIIFNEFTGQLTILIKRSDNIHPEAPYILYETYPLMHKNPES